MIGDQDGEFARVGTGLPQLDEILDGGFPANSVNIVMGHPGSGKTVFAEQMLFHNARREDDTRPVVFLTTLSEPLAKVVTYLQRFSFFDPDLLIDRVVYEDIGAALAADGPGVVVDRVGAIIREMGPKILVVDSFKAIHDLTDSATEMRRLIAELAGGLAAYDTTSFLVGEYDDSHIPVFPEFAVADGILEFARRSTAKRDERFLRVLKLRGSCYQEGFHAFRIDGHGLTVHPRLVAPEVASREVASREVASREVASREVAERERIPSGLAGLDAVLEGGPWRGSSILLMGPAGSGKTTVGLQFALEGARRGEGALYLNFQENPEQLARTIESLGIARDADVMRHLHLQYASPVELQIDSILVELFDTVRREGIRRIVVDSLGDLAMASGDKGRFHDYLYALGQHFRRLGVTALLLQELVPDGGGRTFDHEGRFSSMSDVLIELCIEISTRPRRTLRVVKARGIAHDLRPHELVIGPGGARLDGIADPA